MDEEEAAEAGGDSERIEVHGIGPPFRVLGRVWTAREWKETDWQV